MKLSSLPSGLQPTLRREHKFCFAISSHVIVLPLIADFYHREHKFLAGSRKNERVCKICPLFKRDGVEIEMIFEFMEMCLCETWIVTGEVISGCLFFLLVEGWKKKSRLKMQVSSKSEPSYCVSMIGTSKCVLL